MVDNTAAGYQSIVSQTGIDGRNIAAFASAVQGKRCREIQ